MLLVDAVVVGSVAASFVLVPRVRDRRRDGWSVTPGWALAALTGVLFLNQVLVDVYVLRVHGGNPGFITRYLPSGYFDLERGPAMRALADHWPAPGLLAVSVFRIPSFLEMPFGLLAYGTVLRFLDAGLYRKVMGSALVWAASVSYTTVFCAIEWDLRTPYTTADIVIRCCSAVVTPWLLSRMARADRSAARTGGTLGLLVFTVSTAAFGYLILALYDTVLLYNLGRVPGRLPGMLVALAVLVGARLASVRLPDAQTERADGVRLILDGLGWALVLFFVPALPVRYGVNFGTTALAMAAGLLTMTIAVVAARPAPSVLARVGAAAALGAGCGYLAMYAVADTYYEARLLRGAVVFVGVTLLCCALLDQWGRRRGTDMLGP
jgi:hypothetical protein